MQSVGSLVPSGAKLPHAQEWEQEAEAGRGRGSPEALTEAAAVVVGGNAARFQLAGQVLASCSPSMSCEMKHV